MSYGFRFKFWYKLYLGVRDSIFDIFYIYMYSCVWWEYFIGLGFEMFILVFDKGRCICELFLVEIFKDWMRKL